MASLHLAQINIPYAAEVNNAHGVHLWLARQLAQSFGGFTLTNGHGAWTDADNNVITEPVAVYSIAMENSAFNAQRLRELAVETGKLLQQQAVFICLASGTAEIIDLRD